MSYYFNMAFIQVENELETYKKAQEMANLLMEPEIAEKYIKLHLPWLKEKINLQPNNKITALQKLAFEGLIFQLFEIPFVYWSEHKLLGISSNTEGHYPSQWLQSVTAIHEFQNGADQDYEFSTWSDKIALFKQAKEEAINQMKYVTECDDYEYEIQTLLYEKIYNHLDLSNWIYGNEGNFQRFTLSPITTFSLRCRIWELETKLLQENNN